MTNSDINFSQLIKSFDYSWRVFDPKRINILTEVLNWLENPDLKFKAIHIAGTNGKGSVGEIISTILTEQGFKVGHFSSPFVVSDLEQITINQNQITQEQFIETYKKILTVLQTHQQTVDFLSYFEWLTLIAFCFFAENNLDFAVIEVGIGGVDDATNILQATQLEIFTKIALDHTEILGETISQIAEKKAQIIKNGSSVVIGSQYDQDAIKIIQETAIKKQATIVEPVIPKITLVKSSPTGLDLKINELKTHLNIFGNYQLDNLATSFMAIKQLEELNDFAVDDNTLATAISQVKISGRDYFDQENKILYASAHNPDGVDQLIETIESWNLATKPNLILGILKDKDYRLMIEKIVPIVDDIICVTPAYSNNNRKRVLTASQLAEEILNQYPNKNVMIANDLTLIDSLINKNNQAITIATGSIYTLRALQNDI